jgi:hypothetical protein
VAREHELPLSTDAKRYYESGKRWLYRLLPFWAASLADRFLMVLLPLMVLLIPALRVLPNLYRWRVRQRLVRVYAELLELERDIQWQAADEHAQLLARLDNIAQRADGVKLPVSFADQFYVLREHIGQVRRRLTSLPASRPGGGNDSAPAVPAA